jgi:phospholipase/carboxylesterase
MGSNSEVARDLRLNIGDWTLFVREPEGPGPHPVFLLVHGWTGDENSMLIFASRLPEDALLISPRGLHLSPLGGYGWHAQRDEGRPGVEDFRPSVEALQELLVPANFPQADFARMSGVGFSQGAALIFSFALLHPDRFRSFAGLSGFFPMNAEDLIKNRPLEGKPAFVTHGTRDEIVPVERARQAVQSLEQAGAQVTYCEDEVGHKLSAACFRALSSFFVT